MEIDRPKKRAGKEMGTWWVLAKEKLKRGHEQEAWKEKREQP